MYAGLGMGDERHLRQVLGADRPLHEEQVAFAYLHVVGAARHVEVERTLRLLAQY
jgi:hypothetical protein